jgi:RNA polymerase sigma-70 factor, ECF subfamily
MDVSEIAVERTPRPLRMNEPQLRARHTVDPDAALVERLRRAEAGAVEVLVDTYGDRVYRLALRITGNASDAEEVVQDALWTASRKIDTFRGTAAFGSWLYRITANAAYQKLRGRRSKRNEVSWEDIAPSFDDKGQHAEVAVAWSRKVGDPAIEGELRSVLGSAIDELPPSLQATFLLRDVEGLAYPQIAEILQVTLGTIKVRVHRARLFLRKRLTDYMRESVGVGEAGRCA